MSFVSIYDVNQSAYANLLRLGVNFITVDGRWHQATDVPSVSSSSAAVTARESIPPFPTRFCANNSFLGGDLVNGLHHYCQHVDSANQVAELFGPGGIIRDAERTARQEPAHTYFQGEQGVLAHIKAAYMDPVNNLLQDSGIAANETLDGGQRRWSVEGLGRTLKTDIFLSIGGTRRAVLDVKSPKVCPLEVFGIINQAAAMRAVEIDVDTGLTAHLPTLSPDTGHHETAKRIIKQIWGQMAHHRCRIGVVTTFNDTIVFVAERDQHGEYWISVSPKLSGSSASPESPYHRLLPLLLGLSVLPEEAYNLPSGPVSTPPTAQGLSSAPSPHPSDSSTLSDAPSTNSLPSSPPDPQVTGHSQNVYNSSLGHQWISGDGCPSTPSPSLPSVNGYPTPDSSPEARVDPRPLVSGSLRLSVTQIHEGKTSVRARSSAKQTLVTPPASPLPDEVPPERLGPWSITLRFKKDISIRRSAGRLSILSASTQCLVGPIDVQRLSRPGLPVLLTAALPRSETPPHRFSIEVESAAGHGAIWDVFRCRRSTSGPTEIAKVTSPSIYLEHDPRALPELLLDNSSGHTASAVRASMAREMRVLHHLNTLRVSGCPDLHGVWAGLQGDKEIWAMFLEDCGDEVNLSQLSPLEKKQILRAYGDLHAAGVLHRDVEARHWRQTRPGGPIKIIDFDRASCDSTGRLHGPALYAAEMRKVRRLLDLLEVSDMPEQEHDHFLDSTP